MVNSGKDLVDAPFRAGTQQRGYKKCHWNHPCSKWVRLSSQHYLWLAKLGKELFREYQFRYNGKNHMCAEHIDWLFNKVPTGLDNAGFVEPFLAMPDEYKKAGAIPSYRGYYIGAKMEILTYTKRHVPHWLLGR